MTILNERLFKLTMFFVFTEKTAIITQFFVTMWYLKFYKATTEVKQFLQWKQNILNAFNLWNFSIYLSFIISQSHKSWILSIFFLKSHSFWLQYAHCCCSMLISKERGSNSWDKNTDWQKTMWSICIYIHNTASYTPASYTTLHSSEALCSMECMFLSINSHHYYVGIPYGWAWIKHLF